MARPRTFAAFAALISLVVGLTACATPEPQPRPEAPEQPVPAPQAPQLHPDGTAAENLPFFAETLTQFSLGGAAIEGQPIVDALAAAGFDKSAMQVSFDLTQTNLVADAIFVSVRVDDQCLLGQVVTADRSVTTAVEPAVGPDNTLCLIGSTRPIDW